MKHIHPKRCFRNTKTFIYNAFWNYLVPDEWSIKHIFRKRVGYDCDLDNPRSFNEKIQWLKLHDHNPLYPLLIDKIRVKEMVSRELGAEYVIPMIGHGYSRFTDIPFDELPEQFVLKCNHDAASTIVCKDKSSFDFEKAKRKIEKALRTNYYHYDGKQWGYKDIKPQVFVEKYMQNGKDAELNDYKFLMFNGECKCIFLYAERFSGYGLKMNSYDSNWNLLPFTRHYLNTNSPIVKPDNLDKMLEVANKLAEMVHNDFVRIDLYDINGRIYFGEFTFYPGGGFEEFYPVEWDYVLGSWINLTEKTK